MNAQQRRLQIGRIHAAKKVLGLGDDEYRHLLETFVGVQSCKDMNNRQINHTLDWLNYLSGRRSRQPMLCGRFDGQGGHINMVRLCYAISRIIPAGYEKSPMQSMTWQTRTCGRCAAFFEELSEHELWKLIEGVKAIFRRTGQRDTRDLAEKPLEGAKPQRPKVAI